MGYFRLYSILYYGLFWIMDILDDILFHIMDYFKLCVISDYIYFRLWIILDDTGGMSMCFHVSMNRFFTGCKRGKSFGVSKCLTLLCSRDPTCTRTGRPHVFLECLKCVKDPRVTVLMSPAEATSWCGSLSCPLSLGGWDGWTRPEVPGGSWTRLEAPESWSCPSSRTANFFQLCGRMTKASRDTPPPSSTQGDGSSQAAPPPRDQAQVCSWLPLGPEGWETLPTGRITDVSNKDMDTWTSCLRFCLVSICSSSSSSGSSSLMGLDQIWMLVINAILVNQHRTKV